MSTPTVTIYESPAGNLYARDTDSGNVIAMRRCSYNSAALAQLILDVEMRGYAVDWAESTVANPND